MDRRTQKAQATPAGDSSAQPGSGAGACPEPAPQSGATLIAGRALAQTVRHFFPELNVWLDQFIAVSMTKGAPNPETHWNNPTFTKLWLEYRAQLDATKRHELSVELQRMLWNTGGYIIWGFQDYLDAYSTKLHGIVGGSERNFDMYNFNTAYFA